MAGEGSVEERGLPPLIISPPLKHSNNYAVKPNPFERGTKGESVQYQPKPNKTHIALN
jgi:hypothetical protein